MWSGVPADTPIVVYDVGDRTDLKPGAAVFIVAVKQPALDLSNSFSHCSLYKVTGKRRIP
jgi:hypothetical protein